MQEVQQACSKTGSFYTGCISSLTLSCVCFGAFCGRNRDEEESSFVSSSVFTAPCNYGNWKTQLLPWPLWCRVRVGVDRRRCRVRVGGHSRVWVGRVRRGRILRHHVRMTVGGGVGGRGGGGGGVGEVEVEGGGRSGRGGGRCRSGDSLQDDVRVELRLGAVESGQGGLQQTLLTPEGKREEMKGRKTDNLAYPW